MARLAVYPYLGQVYNDQADIDALLYALTILLPQMAALKPGLVLFV